MVTVSELELLEFFGVLPKLQDPDDPWSYNDALYEVQSGSVTLSFAIAPSYKDVRIILHCAGTKTYELNAQGVQDVRHRHQGERESLEITINEQDALFLFLAPHIEIHHGAQERAEPLSQADVPTARRSP